MVKKRKRKKNNSKNNSIDISNKTLAIFVMLAIIVSVVGLFSTQKETNLTIYDNGIMFTGMVGTNDTIGNVSATIQSYTYINFTNLSISWGTGYVEAGFDYCNLTLEPNGSSFIAPAGCAAGSWTTAPTQPSVLAIENLGNEDVALNLSFDTVATTLLGSQTYNALMWRVDNGEPGSCANNTGGWSNEFTNPSGGTNVSEWQAPFNADQSDFACAWFNSSSLANTINVGILLGIDANTAGNSSATKTVTITAYGRTCDGLQSQRVNCTEQLETS